MIDRDVFYDRIQNIPNLYGRMNAIIGFYESKIQSHQTNEHGKHYLKVRLRQELVKQVCFFAKHHARDMCHLERFIEKFKDKLPTNIMDIVFLSACYKKK